MYIFGNWTFGIEIAKFQLLHFGYESDSRKNWIDA